ncbi:hypothetical protein L1049_004478 [Liquidambar formosana]|uniref:Uncharacterized protein n=1 Tax=Liquidambar formosana TaxID=63359 RepID=A0AAP0X0C2_LIQFO
MGAGVVVEDGFVYEEETHLTVFKTSVFFAGDGFTVYNCKGELLLRVDSYGTDTGELVLMNASGRCLLTVRRKVQTESASAVGRVPGREKRGPKTHLSVRRSSIIGRSSVTVEVLGNPTEEYQIEGSFGQRCCTIFNAGKECVAQITRKVDASAHVVLGKDVFSLFLKPGFDGAFAMGLVLVLDQIDGDDYVSDAVDVEPTAQDLRM